MKRLGTLVFVALVMTTWTIPAYAVDTSFNVQYRVRAMAVENANDFNDANNTDQDNWIDQRFRLGITIKEAPVTGFVQMQFGGNGPNFSQVWGQGVAETGWTFGSGEESFILRQAYLAFPVGPLTLITGRVYWSDGFLGGSLVELVTDAIAVVYPYSDELTWIFIRAKAIEGSYSANTGISMTSGANDNDWDVYKLGFTYKPKGAIYDLAGTVWYSRDGGTAITQSGGRLTTAGSWDALWGAINLNLRPDPFFFNLSGAVLDGKSKPQGGTELDMKGYALHGQAEVNFAKLAGLPLKLGLVAGMGTGDDNTSDNDLETFYSPALASYIQTHIFFQGGENNYSQRFINLGNLNTQGSQALGSTLGNITWGKIYADYKATDKLNLGAAYAVFKQTQALSGTSDDIGNEINLTLNYTLHKNLSLLAFAAWFNPDDGITGSGTAADDTVSEYYARLQWEF
ncbi:MAG: hypothetical protein HY878_02500 [Deltaproteobacteria bacterium]|nr:hypothetical protein [Deltaproteobacteria bacterium]